MGYYNWYMSIVLIVPIRVADVHYRGLLGLPPLGPDLLWGCMLIARGFLQVYLDLLAKSISYLVSYTKL